MRNVKSHIPNSLRKYRDIIGFSQKDVAEMLGFKSAIRISLWENGYKKPSIENLMKLSFLYSTLPAQLYPDLWQDIIKELKEVKMKMLEKK